MAPCFLFGPRPAVASPPHAARTKVRPEDPLLTEQRVIVTGAAGFIGSHTAAALLSRGCTVLGLDNLDPFYDPALKHRNLHAIARHPGADRFGFEPCDITTAPALHAAFQRFRPTSVIHLAARAGVRPSIADPAAYALTNVLGTQLVLSAAHAAGCTRLICASSSSVYGNNLKTPFAETDPVDAPISPYAATKKACELIGHTHHHLTGASVAMLRFFTVFGPGQRPDLAIRLFLTRVTRAEPITVFGDGTTSRDYTFIDDIVAGILAAHDRIDAHGFRVWNLGGDRPIPLTDLVRTVAEVVGREPIIDRRPMQPGDVERTWADLTRSRAELGYNPRTAVREGIARQFAWMKQESLL